MYSFAWFFGVYAIECINALHAIALVIIFVIVRIMNIFSINDLASLAKARRKELGLTQADLASKIGVKPLWISQFENGKATVQVGLVLRALKVLNLPISIDLPAVDGHRSQIESKSVEVIDLGSILNPNKSTK